MAVSLSNSSFNNAVARSPFRWCSMSYEHLCNKRSTLAVLQRQRTQNRIVTTSLAKHSVLLLALLSFNWKPYSAGIDNDHNVYVHLCCEWNSFANQHFPRVRIRRYVTPLHWWYPVAVPPSVLSERTLLYLMETRTPHMSRDLSLSALCRWHFHSTKRKTVTTDTTLLHQSTAWRRKHEWKIPI